MTGAITLFEFDTLAAESSHAARTTRLVTVPDEVHAWLETQALRMSEGSQPAWARLTQRSSHRVVQVTSYVGVIRAPNGFQIEVLPKIGRVDDEPVGETRQRLLDMLCCLRGFRHIQTDRARILSARMPLLEVFVAEFLRLVSEVVKRGLRSAYSSHRGHLPALRGKLLIAQQLRHNMTRADRFFTEHDEFTANRPANRLLHAALRRVLALTNSWGHQQLARELAFAFADIPVSKQPYKDFQRLQSDRGMRHYDEALAWARLILDAASPLTGDGQHSAPSLLFPMAAVFEAFVARHLARQVLTPFKLKTQASSRYLVRHQQRQWFQLKPDLLIRDANRNRLVLDTKWKVLDANNADARLKYGLSQADFYQLFAYGQHYLGGKGTLALIYPKTAAFDQPLPVFEYQGAGHLRLWALPFCLTTRRLLLPNAADFAPVFAV